MKTKQWMAMALAAVLGGAGGAAAQELTKCHMTFSLEGWSVFYKSASGQGDITCANGQSAHVSIRAKGGGLTVGKTDITAGIGDFSEVTGIDQVFGKYASASASAGAGKAAMAQVHRGDRRLLRGHGHRPGLRQVRFRLRQRRRR
jgi:hypothetical protein